MNFIIDVFLFVKSNSLNINSIFHRYDTQANLLGMDSARCGKRDTEIVRASFASDGGLLAVARLSLVSFLGYYFQLEGHPPPGW